MISAVARAALGHPALVELAGGTGTRALVAFPPAGAGATYYHRVLAEQLPRTRVLGVQYPGRQTRFREEPVADRAGLVAEAAMALRTLAADQSRNADGPWRGSAGPAPLEVTFLGHSLGAQIAFETALELAGDPAVRVLSVVLSARNCACPGRRLPSPDPDTASNAELLEWLGSIGGLPEAVRAEPELAALAARQLRGDLRASASPVRPGILSVPLVLVCGEDDPLSSLEGMRPWADRTAAGTREVSVPGDHDAVRTAARQWAAAVPRA